MDSMWLYLNFFLLLIENLHCSTDVRATENSIFNMMQLKTHVIGYYSNVHKFKQKTLPVCHIRDIMWWALNKDTAIPMYSMQSEMLCDISWSIASKKALRMMLVRFCMKCISCVHVARPQSIFAFRFFHLSLPNAIILWIMLMFIGQNGWRQTDIELEESNLRNNNLLFVISSFSC